MNLQQSYNNGGLTPQQIQAQAQAQAEVQARAQSQAQAQMQAQSSGGDNNQYPILPPQLANLTPQQLRQLKNSPQFPMIMRNYLQRQQMARQQQQQQQQQHPGQIPLSGQQHPQPQMRVSPGNPGMMRRGQGMSAPVMQNQAAFGPNSVGAPGGYPARMAGGQVGQYPAKMNIAGGPGIPDPRLQEEALKNSMISQAPKSAIVPGSGPAQPEFSGNSTGGIPVKQLSSLTQWSDKLKSEGNQVPIELGLYENIIKKDAKFIEKHNQLAKDNKKVMDDLLKDVKAYTDIKQLRMHAIGLSAKEQPNNSIWGEGYQGYGNGITNTSTRLILPQKDLTDREMNERINSETSKHLVPIRLDFDQERDRFKLRDTFLWDLNEKVLSVESFVTQMIQDYKFIPNSHYDLILSTIKEQISDFHRKPDHSMGELRVPIKIDIMINNTQLTDQFEWDILNFSESDPEEFSVIMCDEMKLPGEFSTAIAHSIREQAHLFHKALNLVGYTFDGSQIQEEEIRSHLLPSLRVSSSDANTADEFYSVLRNPAIVADFSPSLSKLSQLEVERFEKEIERESRRKRRHNDTDALSSGRSTTSRRMAMYTARGSKTLPDLSDVPKTFRTPAPSSVLPGAVDLGVPDIYSYNEAFVYKTQVRNPDYKPPPPPTQNIRRVQHAYIPDEGRFIVKINYSR